MPEVSVLIITYNKADTLRAAIESVLQQTYRDFEILVVDDGSTDETPERVKPYLDRVRYLRKTNGGTGSARNLGIAQAQGKYVAFLDGDDLWLPQKLQIQMAAFEREPQIHAVQCSAYCVNERLQVTQQRLCTPAQDSLLDFLLFHNLPAFSSTVVIRTEVARFLGGFGTDLVILSDWDMACRLAKVGTLRSVPEILALYRHYESNQSSNVEIHIESGVRSLTRFFSDPHLDPAIGAQAPWIWARFYAMLGGGYFRNGDWKNAFRWTAKAIGRSPRVIPYVLGLPVRALVKRWNLPKKKSFESPMKAAVA